MDFTAWVRKSGYSDQDLSGLLGVDKSFIQRLRTQKRHPSWFTMVKIEKLSGGIVTINDWRERRENNPRPWAS